MNRVTKLLLDRMKGQGSERLSPEQPKPFVYPDKIAQIDDKAVRGLAVHIRHDPRLRFGSAAHFPSLMALARTALTETHDPFDLSKKAWEQRAIKWIAAREE